MPKAENQKIKLFYIADYLMKETDDDYGVFVYEIVEYLNNLGIPAESHSVSRDIKVLRDCFKMDIRGGRGQPYYLHNRDFSIDDLKTIADCIASTKFVSKTDSDKLIDKLKKLCSNRQGESLSREYSVSGRTHTQKTVLSNLACISGAIRENHAIKFHYTKHIIDDLSKVGVIKDSGWKNVIPYQILSRDGNHYLIGYDKNRGGVCSYRIDRIRDTISSFCLGHEELYYKQMHKTAHTRTAFDVSMGEAREITILFDVAHLDAVIDRYADNPTAKYTKKDEYHFEIKTWDEVSPAFYGWLCRFGDGAVITDPPEAVEEFKKHVEKIQQNYC